MRMSDCHPDVVHYAKGFCEKCYSREMRKRLPEHRERKRIYANQYRKNNPEKMAEYHHRKMERIAIDPAYKEQRSSKQKNTTYLRKYGISLSTALEMLAKQGGCAICGCGLDRDTMNVDHCHTTGVIRGILCGKCNHGLGLLGDTMESVAIALQYLKDAVKNGSTVKSELLAQTERRK